MPHVPQWSDVDARFFGLGCHCYSPDWAAFPPSPNIPSALCFAQSPSYGHVRKKKNYGKTLWALVGVVRVVLDVRPAADMAASLV